MKKFIAILLLIPLTACVHSGKTETAENKRTWGDSLFEKDTTKEDYLSREIHNEGGIIKPQPPKASN